MAASIRFVVLLILCSGSNGFLFGKWRRTTCTYEKWGKCNTTHFLNAVRRRMPTPDKLGICLPQTKRCTAGSILANTFIDNLLQPKPTMPTYYPLIRDDPEANTTPVIMPRQPICMEFRDPRTNKSLMGNCNSKKQIFGRKKRSLGNYGTRQKSRDLLIMMDESGSVGPVKFKKLKRIAAAIVKLLCGDIRVRQDKTRVAVMSFDAEIHFHIPLNRFFSDVEDLANDIKKIRFNDSSSVRTCLDNALRFAADEVFTSAMGSRLYDPGIEKDIVLISDGCANCASRRLLATSDYLINMNINVYVIGLNLGAACKNNLKVLAQGGRCFHFFYLDRWDYDVDSFLRELENPPGNDCMRSWFDQSQQGCET